MGLESVKEDILESARAQAGSLIAQAKKEADRMIKEAERKIGEIREKSEAESKIIMDRLKRQELSSAELEKKKMALEAKKQVIEDTFIELKRKLSDMDDKKRELYLKKLLEKAKADIEPAYFYCNKRDAKLLKGVNAAASDISGGLIAENKQKTVIVDYSFDSILDFIKDSELHNISKLLFD